MAAVGLHIISAALEVIKYIFPVYTCHSTTGIKRSDKTAVFLPPAKRMVLLLVALVSVCVCVSVCVSVLFVL